MAVKKKQPFTSAVGEVQGLDSKLLEDFGWRHLEDEATIKAIEARWMRDPKMAKAIGLMQKMVGPDGQRDQKAVDTYVKLNNRGADMLLASELHKEQPWLVALEVVSMLGERRALPGALLQSAATAKDELHVARFALVELIHGIGDRSGASHLLSLLKKFPPRGTGQSKQLQTYLAANAVMALAELGDTAAVPMLMELLKTGSSNIMSPEAPISLREAVRFALGELKAKEALPVMLELAATSQVYTSPALCWALGKLGVDAEAALKKQTRDRLESTRHTEQTIRSADGRMERANLDSLFVETPSETTNRSVSISREIALEHSLVVMGANDAPLKKLVTTTLTRMPKNKLTVWAGHEGDALLCWALMALRSKPNVGSEALARAYRWSAVPLARILSKRILE